MLETMTLEAKFYMTRLRRVNKKKKKQTSFTTLHGILLSLAIAAVVGLIFGIGGGLLSFTTRLARGRGDPVNVMAD
jgi:ABC-type nitrate/sulfonate/bicarbonate transport system permease component